MNFIRIGGHITIAPKQTNYQKDHQGNGDGRDGGNGHVPNMRKQIGSRHGRGQVGSIAKGRHLIAKVGTRNDGSANKALGKAQGLAYTQQGHPYSGNRGPATTRSQRHNGRHNTGRKKEDGRVEDIQAVIDHCGYNPADQPGTRQGTNEEQNQDTAHGRADAFHHPIEHGIP